MDSPEDGSSCGFVSRETSECGSGSRALKDYPNWKVVHSSKEYVSPVEKRFVLTVASGKTHMLVSEMRPLRRDAWKDTQGSRFGPRSMSASIFCLWRPLSACLSGGCC